MYCSCSFIAYCPFCLISESFALYNKVSNGKILTPPTEIQNMSPYMKSLLLLLPIFASVLKVNSENPDSFIINIRVDLVNLLESGADLTIHCKEKHNDLGVFNVKFKERYSFSFKINWFTFKKLFFCSFQWQSGHLYYFNVYDQDRDTCQFCLWNIEEKGPRDAKGACTVWNGKMHNTLGVVTPNNTNITQPQI